MRKVPTYGNELPQLIESVAAYLENALNVLEVLSLSLSFNKLVRGSYYALGSVFGLFSNWLKECIYGRLYDEDGKVRKSLSCGDVEHIVKLINDIEPVLTSIAEGFEKGSGDSAVVSLIINEALKSLDSAYKILIEDIRNKVCSGQD